MLLYLRIVEYSGLFFGILIHLTFSQLAKNSIFHYIDKYLYPDFLFASGPFSKMRIDAIGYGSLFDTYYIQQSQKKNCMKMTFLDISCIKKKKKKRIFFRQFSTWTKFLIYFLQKRKIRKWIGGIGII